LHWILQLIWTSSEIIWPRFRRYVAAAMMPDQLAGYRNASVFTGSSRRAAQ
jgi:hypothetical protein